MERRICSLSHCDRRLYAKQLCMTHYRYQRAGKELKPLRVYDTNDTGSPCRFEGCGRVKTAQGLCESHYQQHRRGKPLRPIGSSQTVKGQACTVCPNKVKAHATVNGAPVCRKHYARFLRHGDMNTVLPPGRKPKGDA